MELNAQNSTEIVIDGMTYRSCNGKIILPSFATNEKITAVETSANVKLAGKQDLISDLDEIRSNAELAKYALQLGQARGEFASKQEMMNFVCSTHDDTKQNKIEDLAAIREGALKGSTALTEADLAGRVVSPAEFEGKIQELTTLIDAHYTEFQNVQGVKDFNEIHALLNEVSAIANKLPKDVACKKDIPAKLSELKNDIGFVKDESLKDFAKKEDIKTVIAAVDTVIESKVPHIPRTVGELLNDANYTSVTKMSDLENDCKFVSFTKVSELENDKGFTSVTKVSELENDKNFVSFNKVSELENDVGFITADYHDESKVNNENPAFTGALSMNRLANSAVGKYSTAEGLANIASGDYSHAEGLGTIAANRCQHVVGTLNKEDDTAVEIVGNGTAVSKASIGSYEDSIGLSFLLNGEYHTISTPGDWVTAAENKDITVLYNRKNIRTLDYQGNETLTGTLSVGRMPLLPNEVATRQYVDMKVPPVPANNGVYLLTAVVTDGKVTYAWVKQ